jgi:FtsP/CotA-like multicopper oxidase with cupredoxin domain
MLPSFDMATRLGRVRAWYRVFQRFRDGEDAVCMPTSEWKNAKLSERPAARVHPGTRMWQIGAEGGMWDKPVPVTRLLLAPAERADVLVDFSRLAGATLPLKNLRPPKPVCYSCAALDTGYADSGWKEDQSA